MARRPPPGPATPGPGGLPPDEVAQAKRIAIKLLAAHGWSVAAMRARLVRRGIPASAADQAIRELVQARLLGDERFAEETAKLEQSRKPAADAFVVRKLRGKGVAAATAKQAATDASEGVSELERAIALARRSLRPGKNDASTRRKLFGVLGRRGFDAETAQEAVVRVMGEAPEQDPGRAQDDGMPEDAYNHAEDPHDAV